MAQNDDENDDCLSIGSQDTDPDQEYVVEEILAVRKFHDQLRFLVKWEDYDLSECTWEPRQTVQHLRAFDTWKIKKKQRNEGLSPKIDVEYIVRQMLEGQARKQHRQRRREKLRARRDARVALLPKKRKLSQRKQTVIIDDSGSEFERSGSTSPSPSPGRSSPAASSSTGHDGPSNLHGIAQARVLSESVYERPKPDQESEPSRDENILSCNGAQADTPTAQEWHTESKKTKANVQAPFIESSDDDDDSLFGLGSPDEPQTLVAHSPDTATSAQPSQATKTLVPVRRSGISMTAKPIDRQKNSKPTTITNPQRPDTWKLSRRWTDQKHILQNNHKPNAEALATFDNVTGRFVPAQGSDLQRQTVPYQHESPDDYHIVEPVTEHHHRVNAHPFQDRTPSYPNIRPYQAGANFTCRRWLKRKGCRFNDRCKLLHELTYAWEPKAPETCDFWANGRCTYVDELCERHHCHPDDRGKFPPTSTPPIGSYSPELCRQLSDAATASLNEWTAKQDTPHNQDGQKNREPYTTTTTTQATYAERLAFLVERYGGTPSDTKSQTCRHWFKERCLHEDRCEFAHSPQTFLRPKAGRQVCKYWQADGCKLSDAKCLYHHCKAGTNNEAISFKYHKTCQEWLNGQCPKSAESCDCYHTIWDPQLPEGSRGGDQIMLDDIPPPSPDDHLFEPASISMIMALETGEHVEILPINILLSDPLALPSITTAYGIGKQIQNGNIDSGRLNFRSTCLAADLSVCIGNHYRVSHQGSIIADSSTDVLDALHSHLSDHEVGAVAYCGSLMVVVHPTDDPTWDEFYPTTTTWSLPRDKGLSIIAFETKSLPDALQISITKPALTLGASTNSLSTDNMLTHGIIDWDIGNMLSSIDDKKDEKKTDKKIGKFAYLMFPLTLAAETAAIRLVLERAGFEVHTPEVAGSWKHDFLAKALGYGSTGKEAAGGVVIWHQAAYNYWEVARMHFTLHRSVINHFIFEPLECGTSDTQQSLSLTRIFPSGYAALMIDSIFIEEPGRALEVVKIITKDISAAKQGFSYCLYVRPDILQLIHTLRLASLADKAKADIYMQLGRLLWKLENPNPFDLDGDTLMNDDVVHSAIICPTTDELPDYCNRLAPNSDNATAALIEQFNLWTLSQVDRLRRFYVLVPEYSDESVPNTLEEGEILQTPRSPEGGDRHTRVAGDMTPKVRAWQEKYQHVFFRSTDKFIEKERKVERKICV